MFGTWVALLEAGSGDAAEAESDDAEIGAAIAMLRDAGAAQILLLDRSESDRSTIPREVVSAGDVWLLHDHLGDDARWRRHAVALTRSAGAEWILFVGSSRDCLRRASVLKAASRSTAEDADPDGRDPDGRDPDSPDADGSGADDAGAEVDVLALAGYDAINVKRPLLPQFASTDDYLGAIDQLEPWLPAVAEVARRENLRPQQGPRVRTCHWIPTFFLPPDHFVKLYLKWSRGPGTHQREVAALQLSTQHDDLPLPRLIGTGSLSQEAHYVVMTRVPGTPLSEVWNDLTTDVATDTAREAGQLMRRIHEMPLSDEERASGHVSFIEYATKRQAWAIGHIEERSLLPDHLVAELEQWCPSADELVGEAGEMVFTHGDFKLSHIFCERGDTAPRLTGVIDLGEAQVGHPLADIYYMWATLNEHPGAREAFMSAAAIPLYGQPDFQRRALAWALLQPQLLHHYIEGQPRDASLDDLAQRAFSSDW